MTTDALAVVGIHIASDRRLGLRHLEHSDLRAIDHTVVALKALSATHAALGLGHGLGFQQGLQPLLEVVQRLLGGQ